MPTQISDSLTVEYHANLITTDLSTCVCVVHLLGCLKIDDPILLDYTFLFILSIKIVFSGSL